MWLLGHDAALAAKVASGALILGKAKELPELQAACQAVRRACEMRPGERMKGLRDKGKIIIIYGIVSYMYTY